MFTKFSFNGTPLHKEPIANTVDIEEIVADVVHAVIGSAVKSAIQPLCKSNDIYFTKLAAIESKMYAFDQAMGRELRKLQTMVTAYPGGSQYSLDDICARIGNMHKEANEIKARVNAIWEGSKLRDSYTHKRLEKLEALIMQIPSLKESIEAEEAKIKVEAEAKALKEKEAALDLRIDELELTARCHNALKNDWEYEHSNNGGAKREMRVRDLVAKTPRELLRTPNFGHKSLREIEEFLAAMGLKLGMGIDEIVTTPKKQPIEAIKHWYELLSPRAVDMIQQRYFSTTPPTYSAIGISMNVSGARIRQIIINAMRNLRTYYGLRISKKELMDLKDVLPYLGNSQVLYKELFD